MSFRAPRATAQSLTHIWISDDVLAEAFNRFVRVSHAHTCRRYGSNVPGPLEARRRQAKRRMGVATHAASGGSPSGDIGALFGLGCPQPDWEKAWRWEPPSLRSPSARTGAPPPPPVPTVNWPWSTLATPESKARSKGLQEDYFEAISQAQASDPVEASTNAFNELLAAKGDERCLTGNDLTDVLNFLQSSADEPLARNACRLVEWLSSRTMTEEALNSLLDVICSKVNLRTLGRSAMPDILPGLLLHENAVNAAASFTHVLDALTASDIRHCVAKVTKSIALSFADSPPTNVLNRLGLWLQILVPCTHMQGQRRQNVAWGLVYHQIAAYMKPSDLPEHFAALSKRDLATILLRHWVVPNYLNREVQNLITSSHRVLSFKRQGFAESSEEMQTILAEWDSCLSTSEQNMAKYIESPRTCLVNLLALLNNHGIPYAFLLDEIFAILKVKETPRNVYRFFRELSSREELGISEQTAIDLIHFFLRTDKPNHLKWAYHVFDYTKTIATEECYELPVKLIEHGFGTPDRIFGMLNRRTAIDTLTPASRTVANLAITNAHVDLVQLVAFAYATAPTISSRVAFRRVWECYRFLQDRSAPMSSLMSRAMVRAGILRPMQDEGAYVAQTQLRYIISVVHRIEGKEVASRLDTLIFHIKKAKLDPEGEKFIRRRRWWAGVKEESMVKAAKWRLRLWSKRQSRTWFSMKGVEGALERVSDGQHGVEVEGGNGHFMSDQCLPTNLQSNMAQDDPDQHALRNAIDEVVKLESHNEEPVVDSFDDGVDADMGDSSQDGGEGLLAEAAPPSSMPVGAKERADDDFVTFRPFAQ